MGAVAGPAIIKSMLTAMTHDLNFRLNIEMDKLMMLSQQSIFIGNQKAMLMQSVDYNTADGAKYKQAYEAMQAKLQEWEAKERIIASMEKQIEMRKEKLEQQLKQAEARKESNDKILEQNTKSAFTLNVG